MIIALLVGILVGFCIAIPPGPVGVSAARFAVFHSRSKGHHFGLGVGIIDSLFALSATFAASAIANAIGVFAEDHVLLMNIFQITIVVIFIFFGIYSLIRSKKFHDEDKKPKKTEFLDKLSHKGPFFLGMAIALSNLANPTFLPSLGYLSLQVAAFHFFQMDFINKILFSLGFGMGNFLWLYLLINIISINKHRISKTFQQRIHQFAGITFISFGTFLGYRLLQIIHWQELLRLLFVF